MLDTDKVVSEYLKSVQPVGIHDERLEQLNACAKKAVDDYCSVGGKEDSRLLFLKNSVEGLLRFVYASGYQDGFFSNPSQGFVFINGKDLPSFIAPNRKEDDGG